MIEDDELRRRITDAHADDAPPPFAALVARPRRRRLALAMAAPVALALAAALLLFLVRPVPPPARSLHVDARGPLDFLLQMPGGELIHDTPHFDQEGAIP